MASSINIEIVQVLISIQSMILCEEPYLNEPGWADSAGTAASKACESIISLDEFMIESGSLGHHSHQFHRFR